jgi:hypothetical protein
MMKSKMKAGIYYIGDPCYLFDKSWGKILDENNHLDDGEHEIFGKKIFTGETAYGDGTYTDNYGNAYWVDAGLLSIIPVSLIMKDCKETAKSIAESDGMHIVKFEEDFECSVENGVFQFGDIVINTRDEDENDP